MALDTALLHLLNGLGHPVLDALMVAVTVLVLPAMFAVPPFLLATRQRRAARILMLLLISTGVLAVGLQFAILRARPDHVRLVLDAPDFPSFPSGHAAMAFALATFLSLVRGRAATGWLVVAVLTALSRVYLGHHFPSDVLVGSVVGAGAGAVAYGVAFAAPSPRRPSWAWWLWAQLAVLVFASVGAYLGLTRVRVLMVPGIDKVLHFVLFGVFSMLLVGWFGGRKPARVIGALAAVAVLDEALQALAPTRTFDLLDLACTLAGVVVLGALGVRWARPDALRRPSRRRLSLDKASGFGYPAAFSRCNDVREPYPTAHPLRRGLGRGVQ